MGGGRGEVGGQGDGREHGMKAISDECVVVASEWAWIRTHLSPYESFSRVQPSAVLLFVCCMLGVSASTATASGTACQVSCCMLYWQVPCCMHRGAHTEHDECLRPRLLELVHAQGARSVTVTKISCRAGSHARKVNQGARKELGPGSEANV